uniref:Uncharacterized protein n=1 Tax=Arundo donax TaxID=35708 RepID=A0A0A8YU06_ARUDO
MRLTGNNLLVNDKRKTGRGRGAEHITRWSLAAVARVDLEEASSAWSRE